MRTFPRRTLSGPARFEGLGLHRGEPVVVSVHPGERGIWLWQGNEHVMALPENVSSTSRCTGLGPVGTVEHLLSALAGLGITDAEIEVVGQELPALDGSSAVYVAGLRDAGFQPAGTLEVEGPFSRVFEKSVDSEIAISYGEGLWRYAFLTKPRWPGAQVFELLWSEDSYGREIAPARTFGFEEELEAVRAAGLGKGLSESSAILLGADGYLNPVRFEDEPARHKLLDLIGDLSLAQVPVAGLNVVAARSGHTANVRAAAKLAQHVVIRRLG